MIRSVGQDVVILVNLPKIGRYYLDIFVAPDARSDSMDHACAFMINCTNTLKDNDMMFPQIGMFGRTPYFLNYEFEEETHPDPYIMCKEDVILALTMRRSVRMSHTFKLYNTKDRSFTDYDRFVFPKHKGDSIVSYIIRCPVRGTYVFTIMAEMFSDEKHTSGKSHAIFKYFIDCKSASSHRKEAFPKTSKRWSHCKLLSPYCGDLPANADVRFKLDSTVAHEIAVVVGDNWTHLDFSGSIWQGVVNTGSAPGKVFVYSRPDRQKKKYIPFLEYYVVTK